METDGRVEKQSTVFPHVLAKRLGAFCTVPTGFTAVIHKQQNRTFHLLQKPDISICYRQPFSLFRFCVGSKISS